MVCRLRCHLEESDVDRRNGPTWDLVVASGKIMGIIVRAGSKVRKL